MASTIERTIDRQTWLEPVGEGLQQVAKVTLDLPGGLMRRVRNFLHGVWLGHPLHPVLTDIPLGAWTAATVLDVREMVTGDRRLAPGTDAVIGIGLVGAAGAAITSLNDWQHTDRTARRVGVVHGVLNTSVASLFLSSWLLRRQGKRRPAQALSMTGWCMAVAAAYLGGKLVYDERVGVDHAPRQGLPKEFVAVLPNHELQDNEPRRVEANGIPVVLVRRNGQIFALAETCAHLGGPLAEGDLEGDTIRCPWHGSRYSLETGEVVEGPSTYPQPCFETRVRDGQIEVRSKAK